MKLSSNDLRKIIAEEAAKFKLSTPEEAAKEVEVVDADELADSLEKHVDMMKVLKMEENRLERRLKKIREEKRIISKRITESK